jgi:eukaryotic-like serine/threonine-protein kinase
LPIAKQIVDAFEAAHEQGIIHRDLKPANIKVRSDGTVKVLDFGLAKAMEPVRVASASVSMSPTITTPAMMTGAGIILGTAAYMSPEQARGKTVDKRADIWAFGCVLFEMLTGQRPFEGESISDVLASVLKSDPNWQAMPAGTPTALRRLMGRCLEKDPKRRLQAIGEARVQIEDLQTGPLEPVTGPEAPLSTPLWPRLALVGVAALVIGAAVALTGSHRIVYSSQSGGALNLWWKAANETGPAEQLTTSANVQWPTAISSDGKQVVLTELTPTGRDLMLLTLDGSHRVAPLLQTPFDELHGYLTRWTLAGLRIQ